MRQIVTSVRLAVKEAMQLLNLIGVEENPSYNEMEYGLIVLNTLIDRWNSETLMTTGTILYNLPLTGKEFYTLGTGGDLNIRPSNYISNIVFTNKTTYQLESLDFKKYDILDFKDMKSDPDSYYYEPSFPLGSLYVYPAGNEGSLSIRINSQLDGYDTIDQEIMLPPAYREALIYALAVRLGIKYGIDNLERIESIALGAKSQIQTVNADSKYVEMQFDSRFVNNRRFNIFRGE